MVFVLALVGSTARADFDLPILSPVPKTVSVPEDIPLRTLKGFARVRDLTIEVRMTGGNMLTDRLADFIEKTFAGVPKRIVLGGMLKPVHVEQLRKLSKLQIRYQTGSSALDDVTITSLYALGPVHKVIVLDQGCGQEQIDRLKKLKFFVPALRIRERGFTLDKLGWLQKDRSHPKLFVLPADFDPGLIYELIGLRPLQLEIHTRNNRLAEQQIAVLRDLRHAELTLVVDGNVTLEDARRFTRLDRFSLKVELGQPPRIIPGLVQVLNRIAPP